MFTTGCGDAGAQDARRMEAAAEEEEEPELLSWGIWEERRGNKSPGTAHACLEFAVCTHAGFASGDWSGGKK